MGRKSEGDIPLLPVHRDGPLPNDNVTGACPWGQTDYSIPGGWKDSTCCGDYKGVSTFDFSLNNNPDELYRFVSDQMMIPPRLFVNIQGRADGSSTTSFNFTLDLTSTIVASVSEYETWNKIYCNRVLEKSDKKEDGQNEDNTLLSPELGYSDDDWLMRCSERYCDQTKGAKEFMMTRKIQGLSLDLLQQEFHSYLRQIFPLHKIDVSCSAPNNFISICSPHWINQLRKNSFIWWLCVLTQLWIVTLPVVCFTLTSYRVVQVIWNVSRNVEEPNSPSGLKRVYAQGRDEEKIADFWAPTMINAARSGLNNEEVLTMNDMDDILRRARERSDVLRIHGLENPTNGSTDNASGET